MSLYCQHLVSTRASLGSEARVPEERVLQIVSKLCRDFRLTVMKVTVDRPVYFSESRSGSCCGRMTGVVNSSEASGRQLIDRFLCDIGCCQPEPNCTLSDHRDRYDCAYCSAPSRHCCMGSNRCCWQADLPASRHGLYGEYGTSPLSPVGIWLHPKSFFELFCMARAGQGAVGHGWKKQREAYSSATRDVQDQSCLQGGLALPICSCKHPGLAFFRMA